MMIVIVTMTMIITLPPALLPTRIYEKENMLCDICMLMRVCLYIYIYIYTHIYIHTY